MDVPTQPQLKRRRRDNSNDGGRVSSTAMTLAFVTDQRQTPQMTTIVDCSYSPVSHTNTTIVYSSAPNHLPCLIHRSAEATYHKRPFIPLMLHLFRIDEGIREHHFSALIGGRGYTSLSSNGLRFGRKWVSIDVT